MKCVSFLQKTAGRPVSLQSFPFDGTISCSYAVKQALIHQAEAGRHSAAEKAGVWASAAMPRVPFAGCFSSVRQTHNGLGREVHSNIMTTEPSLEWL